MGRPASIHRKTGETDIDLELELDGTGSSSISTGVGFLDHMLTLLAKHALFDLRVTAKGDLHIDDHHTVEDVGIALGQALSAALGEKRGIHRYGHMTLPMDEVLMTTAVDLGGRFAFAWNVPMPVEKVGTFDVQLAEDFWRAVAEHGKFNFHALLHYGRNGHHILEAVFKSSARSLRQAVAFDERARDQIPSSKGVL
ncbi:Imidazoleglycerol-phosphate dehydratase [Planctomycetes bacterium Pan216]|uniref:Imidazoleglycerol-phosphate dehydratase n=1 Tax=Kolteria novifilia TaxID=2527975 RepID=A0A518B572_9BACT|nr:Imidazoleglycerol-phosphate dehydratase [Planctomycetes bacterium Pan216]